MLAPGISFVLQDFPHGVLHPTPPWTTKQLSPGTSIGLLFWFGIRAEMEGPNSTGHNDGTLTKKDPSVWISRPAWCLKLSIGGWQMYKFGLMKSPILEGSLDGDIG